MSWIGGIVGMVVGGKTAIREGAISDQFSRAAGATIPFVRNTGGDLKRWGEEDFDRFKETYRPVAERLVDDANRDPDVNRYQREVAVTAARGEKGANDAMRRGVNPASGSFAAGSRSVASNAARMRGIGTSQANLEAKRESTGKKLRVLNMGRSDTSASIAGLGLVVKSGAEYGKYAGDFAQRAAGGWGVAAKGVGQTIGGFKKSSSPTTYNSPDYNSSGSPDYGWGSQGDADEFNDQNAQFDLPASFADGGVIRGPGTGRSDSIPANIDGQQPARVSNGEYHIKADVAASIGLPKLNALISVAPK
ncbi:MAG: hypothetical protein M1457_03840 [bacterium]|nr:hypothetical protein [bacterium]